MTAQNCFIYSSSCSSLISSSPSSFDGFSSSGSSSSDGFLYSFYFPFACSASSYLQFNALLEGTRQKVDHWLVQISSIRFKTLQSQLYYCSNPLLILLGRSYLNTYKSYLTTSMKLFTSDFIFYSSDHLAVLTFVSTISSRLSGLYLWIMRSQSSAGKDSWGAASIIRRSSLSSSLGGRSKISLTSPTLCYPRILSREGQGAWLILTQAVQYFVFTSMHPSPIFGKQWLKTTITILYTVFDYVRGMRLIGYDNQTGFLFVIFH